MKHRLSLGISLLLLLVLGPIELVTASEPAGSRRATRTYTGPATALSTDFLFVGTCNADGSQPGCVRFPLRRKDRFVSLALQDATGQPVYAVVWDHSGREIADACGESEAPFPSPGGPHIDVWLIAGHCYETTTPSIVTTGSVTATFTRR